MMSLRYHSLWMHILGTAVDPNVLHGIIENLKKKHSSLMFHELKALSCIYTCFLTSILVSRLEMSFFSIVKEP